MHRINFFINLMKIPGQDATNFEYCLENLLTLRL